MGWTLEGAGRVDLAVPNISIDGFHLAGNVGSRFILVVDATAGETWISQDGFFCEGRNFYRVSCWAGASQAGATIRLQSTQTWNDFALASHSGSGESEYLCTVGMVSDEGPLFPARVKIQVAGGMTAIFDNVQVEAIAGP